jgi:hypothetical protein
VKTLLAALGIDPAQWKALTISALKLDLRTSSFGGGRAHRTTRAVSPLLWQLLFYLGLGIFMAIAVSWLNDLFVAALILMSYVVFMVGTAILLDHGSAVTSPTDYAVLGYQPITSRTWFAARLTNVLVYTLAMTTAVGLVPAIVFFTKYGIAVGVAAVIALYACATSITLVIIISYASIMRLVGAHRVRTLLSYLQLVGGFVIYGSYFVVSEVASKSVLATLSLPKTPWLLLYPATWFASYIELAAGRTGTSEVLPALASVALLVLLALGLRGRLSLDYAERLGAIASTTAAPPSSARANGPGFWFRTGEARAVAILVRAQFRNDLKFRMGVLAVLPLTILYLFMGLRNGGGDGANGPAGGNLSMVTLAVLLFPAMLKLNLARSDAFRASWIFFATPASRTGLIRSSKNALVAFFLLPYLAFVGVTLAWFLDDGFYIVLYLLFAGLLSHLVLLLITFLDPELPFSKPIVKGRSTSRLFLVILVMGVIGSTVPLILRALRDSPLAIMIGLALIVAISWFIDRMTRVRVERQAARMEFEG